MTHRPDIDGLRALAVIPVVLFHMDLAAVSGGYIGVDVFFVISGFLITSIIAHDLATPGRRFSLATFYERRVRRIFPALFTVLGVTTLLAAVVLLPRDFEAYAKSLVATSAFASNIHFHRQFGYFDTEAHAKPLLHTWSLSVEEQFYLVFPLLMIGLFAWARRRATRRVDQQGQRSASRAAVPYIDPRVPVRRALLVLALGSFALATWQVASGRAEAAFYLSPARAWELLIGSLLALGAVPAFRTRWTAESAAVLGLALLVYGFTAFSLETPFPGVAALVPTLGAALLIHSGCLAAGSAVGAGPPAVGSAASRLVPSNTAVSRLLASRPLVAVGLISYSLYLWHWSLLSMARHWTLEPLTLAQTTVVVLASVALSAASWKWIEQPMRGLGKHRQPMPATPTTSTPSAPLGALGPRWRAVPRIPSPRARVFAAGAAISAFAIAVGLAGALSGGWPSRISPAVLALDAAQRDFNERRPECHAGDGVEIPYRDTCRFGAPSVAPRFAVWGDSHAAELAVALGEYAGKSGEAVRMVSFSRCPPAVPRPDAARNAACLAHNTATLEAMRADTALHTVFLVARYSQARDDMGEGYFDHLGGAADALTEVGKRVVVVYPSPEYEYIVPVQLARAAHRGEDLDALGLPRDEFERRRQPFVAALDGIRTHGRIAMVDPARRLCDETRCRIHAEGHALYFDDDHLSMAGARYVAPLFAPWIEGTAAPRAGANSAVLATNR